MVAKCANPSCSKAFRYLHEGKLYRLKTGQPNGQSSYQRSEWFWLCDDCVRKVALRVEVGNVVTMPLPTHTHTGLRTRAADAKKD
jgi:hypothetical protein